MQIWVGIIWFYFPLKTFREDLFLFNTYNYVVFITKKFDLFVSKFDETSTWTNESESFYLF